MPWNHCGREILDSDDCPDCGMDKETWTVEFNVVRPLTIRRPALRVTLVYDDGRPAGEVAFRATLPGGEAADVTTDELGMAKVVCPSGTAVVEFEGRDRLDVFHEPPEEEAESEPSDSEEPADTGEPGDPAEADDPEPARFEVSVGPRHVFHLTRPGVIHAELRRAGRGGVLASVAYEITLDDGSTLSGSTDGDGVLRHEDVPVGDYRIRAGELSGRVEAFPGEEDGEPEHVTLIRGVA